MATHGQDILLPHDWLILHDLLDTRAVTVDEAPSAVGDVATDSALEVTVDGHLHAVVEFDELLSQQVARVRDALVTVHILRSINLVHKK